MLHLLKRADLFVHTQFDALGFLLQIKFGFHVADIVKLVSGVCILMMSVVAINIAGMMTYAGKLTIFVPYACMLSFYLVIMVPYFNRKKREWGIDGFIEWFQIATSVRRRLLPLKVVTVVAVLVFATVPAFVGVLSGGATPLETVKMLLWDSLTAFVVPGFVPVMIYFGCIIPLPPSPFDEKTC